MTLRWTSRPCPSPSLLPPPLLLQRRARREAQREASGRGEGQQGLGPPVLVSPLPSLLLALDSKMMIAHRSSAPSPLSSSRREGTSGEQQPRALSAPGCWSRARQSLMLMEGSGPVGSIGMRTGLMKGRSRMVPLCDRRPGPEVGEAIRCASAAAGGGARRGEARRRWRSGRDRHKDNGRQTAGAS